MLRPLTWFLGPTVQSQFGLNKSLLLEAWLCPHCTLNLICICLLHFHLPNVVKMRIRILPTLLTPNLIPSDAGRQLTCVGGRLFPQQETFLEPACCVWSQAWLILPRPHIPFLWNLEVEQLHLTEDTHFLFLNLATLTPKSYNFK